jgi:Domain of unknown function (DUF5134)
MFPTLAFTAIFTATGLRSLARLVALPGGDRTTELSQLLMSVAMVGMAWGWPAGTDTVGGLAQLVVFGVLAVVFVVRLLDPAEGRSAGSAHQLLMLGAMVWMLLAMPGSHGHHGQSAAPALTQLVTVAFAVPLCGAAVALVSRRAPVLVPAAAPPQACLGPRPDLAGHVLMSGGMAAMLLAML